MVVPVAPAVRTVSAVVAAVVLVLGSSGCADAEAEVPAASPGQVQRIDSEQGAALIRSDRRVLVVDVRTREEYMDGHLVGAQHIPVEDEALWDERVAALDPEQPTVVYCRSGRRSEIAAGLLLELGFTEVYDLGGVQDWDPGDLPLDR